VILTEPERARLLGVTHDAILVRDLDGIISYWNRGAETVYGWTASDAVGRRSHTLLNTVSPGSLSTFTRSAPSCGSPFAAAWSNLEFDGDHLGRTPYFLETRG
jgi:PAS domain-containing protein